MRKIELSLASTATCDYAGHYRSDRRGETDADADAERDLVALAEAATALA